MQGFDPKQVVRPDIVMMEPYAPIVPFDILSAQLGKPAESITKLDANENPYGPPPAAIEALINEKWFHIYPDPESTALRAALSAHLSLPVDRLLAGMGADELIDLILRATLAPEDGVINCPPTFGMYPFSTAVNGGKLIEVFRLDDFALDLPAIKRAVEQSPQAKVLFLCSPNNPDGRFIRDEELLQLLNLPLLVVLDEAYIEFAAADGYFSRMDWALRYSNLVVIRTFSKLAGLAGLRVGYGIFPEWLLPQLWKIKQPYNVNVAASRMAIASLMESKWMNDNVERIVSERRRMVSELLQFEYLKPYPSSSNFVLFRVIGRSAAILKEQLAAQGVLVRYFNKPGLANCIRISAGRPEDTDKLIAALAKCD